MKFGAERCPATTYDRLSDSQTQCKFAVGHKGRHDDGAMTWEDRPSGARLKYRASIVVLTEHDPKDWTLAELGCAIDNYEAEEVSRTVVETDEAPRTTDRRRRLFGRRGR